MKDGRLGKCKDCAKEDAARHRSTNISKLRKYDVARAKLPHRKDKAARQLKAIRADAVGSVKNKARQA